MHKRLFLITCLAVSLSISDVALASSSWSYEGTNGPANWAYLRSDYAICASGQMQSPINITAAIQTELPAIDFHYGMPGRPFVTNNGHTIRVSIPQGRYITVDGRRYDLLRIQFHSPSENTLEGHTFAMAAHFIHASAEGELAIVAVMFELGEATPALNKIWKKLPQRAGGKAGFLSIDVAPLLPENKSYYTFTGSLSEPPCTEGVRWFVLKSPMPISKEQLDRFHEIYNGNVRPEQPANGREIMGN